MDREAEARIDRALVARALCQDDRQAFDQLVRRHQGVVRAQLRLLCAGDAALADDLAQETFLQAWRKLHSFRGEARFSSWLYRIAHTTFLQERRRRVPQSGPQSLPESWPESVTGPLQESKHSVAKSGPTSAPPAGDATELSLIQDESKSLRADLESALRQLPEGERMVLLYHAQCGMSHEDTARITGLPLGTVKTHALRGKARLRAWLSAYQTSEPNGALP